MSSSFYFNLSLVNVSEKRKNQAKLYRKLLLKLFYSTSLSRSEEILFGMFFLWLHFIFGENLFSLQEFLRVFFFLKLKQINIWLCAKFDRDPQFIQISLSRGSS